MYWYNHQLTGESEDDFIIRIYGAIKINWLCCHVPTAYMYFSEKINIKSSFVLNKLKVQSVWSVRIPSTSNSHNMNS